MEVREDVSIFGSSAPIKENPHPTNVKAKSLLLINDQCNTLVHKIYFVPH